MTGSRQPITSTGLDPGVHIFLRDDRARRRGWPDQVRSRGRTNGFTLIEVLVALAIIGLALGAIASVFGNGLMGHETAADAEAALAVAEEQLALAGATPRPGATSGSFAGRFAWQVTVARYDDGAKATDMMNSLPLLYRIAVTVAWRDGRHSRQVSLSTLRLAAAPP